MSLPSVARDKISNKVSLVTRPSVTSIQPVQVIGTTASQPQPKLIYTTVIQSIQPSSQIQRPQQQQPQYQHQHQQQYHQQQSSYFSTIPGNKSKPLSQQISIISSKTIRPPTVNKIVQLPSTSISTAAANRVQPTIAQIVAPTSAVTATAVSVPNRVQTIHFKSNVPSAPIHQKTAIVNPVANISRPILNDKPPPPQIVPVIANIKPPPPSSSSAAASTAAAVSSIKRSETIIQKLHPISSTSSNHKTDTATANVTKVDPVKYRYRTILENLLLLKNNFVKQTITQAIKQKLCNQSNEDLLNVIFKSFELTLQSVNVQEISLNETYLNATLAFLAKVIETGRFMELIEDRKQTKDIGRFVTSEMSSVLNKVSLHSVYKNAREIFAQEQRGSYAQILELLNKVISCVKLAPEARMAPAEIEFWLKEVFPLIFDADDDIQTNALEAIEKAMPLLITSRHQQHTQWPKVRDNILSDYTQKIVGSFKLGSPKWYTAWCLCVRLLDVDIPRSASTLNAFLSIVEPALRSNVPIRRAEGYLCWKVLLEVLVRHNRLNSEKRLKLMCTPLKSLQAKTVEIATNKFKAWWYVICNVQENVENYLSMVFEPFLQFSFGQLFPTPNLQLQPNENATQVKSFPSVSLMAICAFIRMLDESDKQIDELFAKFVLNQPLHLIVSETIFRICFTSALIINACGEATIMLNNLANDSNNNIDCTTLAVVLWTRLFKHVNQAKKTAHINLILDNVLQMMKIVSLNPSKTKMIPVVCVSIIGHISESFVFQSDQNVSKTALDGYVSTIVAKYMHASSTLPNISANFESSLSKLLSNEQDTGDFVRNFTNFLTIIDEQMFKTTENTNNSTGYFPNKFSICCEFVNVILTHIQLNADAFKPLRPNSKATTRIPSVFYKIVYWPLSLQLIKTEFDIYTKTLLKTIDLLLAMINRADFCKESAKIVKTIIESPVHCVYINDTIATLFEYMVYDFNDLKDAPTDMLNLCAAAIKSETKATFQDLNVIAEALIKYRRAIGQKQFNLIAPKIRDVVKLFESEKANMRTEAALIKDLKELIGDAPSSKSEKTTPTSSNKLPRTSNRNDRIEKDDFVVVNKVWKLEPNKLTEHQREKMKTRRCDIPAMYNDLSQSQDSCSIQEWTPTALANKSQVPAKLDNKDNNADKTPPNSTKSAAESNESPASQRGKRGAKVSPKRSAQNQSQSQQNQNESDDRKSDTESEPPEDGTSTKRRLTRELNRIHINAKHDEVPYSNLSESNRLTRSTAKKTVDEKPLETSQERRKTRSESTKTIGIKDVKKKITRASMANSPKQSKQKNKTNVIRSMSNTSDKDGGGGGSFGGASSGEPMPKRRLTRQSKTEESDADETIDDKKIEIKKVELKKTEFVDTLELKVEKLGNELAQTNDAEVSENKIEPKEILIETKTVVIENQVEVEQEIEAQIKIPSEATTSQMDNENESVQKSIGNTNECTKMDVDETVEEVTAAKTVESIADAEEILNENHESINEVAAEPKIQIVPESKTSDTELDIQVESKQPHFEENEQSSQILVETATVPIDNEPVQSAPPPPPPESSFQQAEPIEKINENDIESRSYMDALVFDSVSPSKSMNGSTLITSPEIGAPRSLEFLNDTLNISPITSGDRENEKHPETSSADQAANGKKSTATNLTGIEKLDDSIAHDKQTSDGKTEQLITVTVTTNENEATVEKEQIMTKKDNIEMESGRDVAPTIPAVTPSIAPVSATPLESPAVSTSRQLKISLPMQSSTPLQSHHSPVSSKFKSQFTGRGAQLLKMINSNRSPKPASPTPASVHEHAFKTASPTINQLETAPICENTMYTPEAKSTARDKHAHEKQHQLHENGKFLTLSGALPSPYESPGISILKRKSAHISMDDSMHSPAPKRKRVSFGFPLSQTKEYIIDDDFTPFYMLPSNDSPSRRTNRMKKLKFKRNKYHTDSSNSKVLTHDNNKSASAQANESRVSKSGNGGGSTSVHGKNEEVSVKHIQEYLGMDMESYKAKQLEKKKFAAAAAATVDNDDDDDDDDEDDDESEDDSIGAVASDSEDSSTESNDDDPENEPTTPISKKSSAMTDAHAAPSINTFSDDAIMAHLLSKYSPIEILKKFGTEFDAKVLTKHLSSMMSSDKHIESAVLEDLAEIHSESFLEHAITENLCSVICDQLTIKSPNGINDYIADKMNTDDQFASDFLDRVSVSVLRQKLMDIVTSSKREQQILLCDFLAALKDAMYRVSPRVVDTDILPEHIHLWVAKLFDQFKLTPEQYLQLTSIYIQKNPPATLDHLE